MRFASRSFGVALASLGLLGVFGCAEDNQGDTAKTEGKVDPNAPTQADYSKLQQQAQQGGQGQNPYAQGGGSYPGAAKNKSK